MGFTKFQIFLMKCWKLKLIQCPECNISPLTMGQFERHARDIHKREVAGVYCVYCYRGKCQAYRRRFQCVKLFYANNKFFPKPSIVEIYKRFFECLIKI